MIRVNPRRSRGGRCSLNGPEKTYAVPAFGIFAENRVQIEGDNSVNWGVRDKTGIHASSRTKGSHRAKGGILPLHEINKFTLRDRFLLPKEGKISVEFLSNKFEKFGVGVPDRFYDSRDSRIGVAYLL